MSEEMNCPLSNTPEHLNWLADAKRLRLGKLLNKAEGSSKMFDMQELHAASHPEMFAEEWEPKIQGDSLVNKTDAQIEAEALAAREQEHQRLLAAEDEKARKYLKIFYITGGIVLGIIALVLLVIFLRK